jgi:mannan endo-1,4-beta-mannosidase
MHDAGAVIARSPRASRTPPPALPHTPLAWVHVAPGAPYFATEQGEPWTPVGHNDAITWPELVGLYRRRDLAAVEAHLAYLAASGVTCIRLMLEYTHGEHRYLERPAGRFVPAMVRLWDDLVALAERVGMRLLLTPFDTFFLWRRWAKHPYNQRNGGPCASRTQLLACADTRAAVKARLAFATERWGGSGAVFAWDLWNEFHPAQGGRDERALADFVDDVSGTLRELELRRHGRAHPQTLSVFGPELDQSPWLNAIIFRHPGLDFANSHFYEAGTIDQPRNTVDAAVSVGKLVRRALGEIADQRPFFDSEHGPIHTFKDRHRTLPAAFDDEYFRHIQWAHLASGAAGGGMRWPNRHPHTLTPGMREAQRALSAFLPLVDWPRFARRNVTDALGLDPALGLAGFACASRDQAVVYLLRTTTLARDGTLRPDAAPAHPRLTVPGLERGDYAVTRWDTRRGEPVSHATVPHDGTAALALDAGPVATDLAIAIRREG